MNWKITWWTPLTNWKKDFFGQFITHVKKSWLFWGLPMQTKKYIFVCFFLAFFCWILKREIKIDARERES